MTTSALPERIKIDADPKHAMLIPKMVPSTAAAWYWFAGTHGSWVKTTRQTSPMVPTANVMNARMLFRVYT